MLHPLESGETILRTTVTRYLEVFPQVTVLHQPDAGELISSLDGLNVELVESPGWEEGLSQSLIAGVRYHSDASAWMIALGDMPYVSRETIQRLIEQADAEHIVQPRCEGRAGNPVVFGRTFYDNLLHLSGDQGAKGLLTQFPDQVRVIDCDDRGVLRDIDQPADIRTGDD